MKLALFSRYGGLFTIAALLLTTSAMMAEEERWVSLTDLSAWRGYQQKTVPKAWQIDADGVLTLVRAENDPAVDLITKEQYGDFDLRFDWKIAPDGNSGVMYRVTEDKEHAYYTGPEYQVLDDAAPDYVGLADNQYLGSLYGLYARSKEVARPAGQWNAARIVLNGNTIEHWLNGEKVVSAQIGSEDWNDRIAASKFAEWDRFAKNAQGHIVLQDHGSQVWYRNLRVRHLNLEAEPAADGASNSSSKRLLLVTQSEGYEHSTITRQSYQLSHTERILTKLGVQSGAFRVDCTKDVAKDFTPELVSNYDVVAFYTTGDLPIPTETLDWLLTTYLAEEGHGFLGLHSATDTFMEHPLYRDMIGGTFNGHPWTKDANVVLKIHDGDHPASRPWGSAGDRVAHTDEIYQYNHWQPKKVRVLMSLDMERTELKKPYHIPVLWVKSYGTGRVMNMSLGHREETWENPTYQASLLGGIRWLLGEEAGDATPNPEVSAAEEVAAKAAAGAVAVGS